MKTAIETPWGIAQDARPRADGITFYTTASHGGYHLSPERQAEVCARFPGFRPFAGGPWYEEDCDAAAVVIAFAGHFTPDEVYNAVRYACQLAATFGGQWDAVEHWLDTTAEGRAVAAIADARAYEVRELWQRGGLSTEGKSWTVRLYRPWTGERRVVMMPEYPRQQYFSDEELHRNDRENQR